MADLLRHGQRWTQQVRAKGKTDDTGQLTEDVIVWRQRARSVNACIDVYLYVVMMVASHYSLGGHGRRCNVGTTVSVSVKFLDLHRSVENDCNHQKTWLEDGPHNPRITFRWCYHSPDFQSHLTGMSVLPSLVAQKSTFTLTPKSVNPMRTQLNSPVCFCPPCDNQPIISIDQDVSGL